MRDIARRLYLVRRERISGSGTGFRGVKTIPVASLFQTINTPIGILRSMYYGYQGGFKFKIVARGCDDLSVRYIPPEPVGDPIQAPVFDSTNPGFSSDLGENYRISANGGSPSSVCVPVPFIETADTWKVQHLTQTTNPGGVVEIDFSIGYNSQLEYTTPNMSAPPTPSSDMGGIVVSISTPASDLNVLTSYEIYMGLDDNGRFGHLFNASRTDTRVAGATGLPSLGPYFTTSTPDFVFTSTETFPRIYFN